MDQSWALGPFTKRDEVNPILGPNAHSVWDCPLAGPVAWEAKDVFNPAAVGHDGQIHLLYRAEDTVGRHLGTSRIGLATSQNGLQFDRDPTPVVFPSEDELRPYEWEGGCEDPRVCATDDGQFVMTYTAYDGTLARLCVATSPDLRHWTKHGLAFPEMPSLWSKSGAIVCRDEGNRLIATRIDGQYWMYWGESSVFAATSDDLLHWHPVALARPAADIPPDTRKMPGAPEIPAHWKPSEIGQTTSEREAFVPVIRPRTGRFDSELVEPGPPAVLTPDGIVLLYNGKHAETGTYAVGQVLLDAHDPTAVLARLPDPCLSPDRDYERTGQVGNVCFVEGLVPLDDQWFLYYGTADSQIAVASAPR